jgi:hypothetical protein
MDFIEKGWEGMGWDGKGREEKAEADCNPF